MKKKVTLAMLLAIVSLAVVLFTGCDPKDKEKPEDILLPPSLGITKVETKINDALVTVDISSPGGSAISELGVIFESKKIKAIEDPAASLTKFSVELTDLQPNTEYSIKAYAVNSFGTTNGTEVIFKTKVRPPLEKITDIDGNQYEIIVIGTQTWTVQDLKVKHYRDGTPIEQLLSFQDFDSDQSGAFLYYNHDIINPIILYNFWAAMSEHQIAPIGWHVATIGDWSDLNGFLWTKDPGNEGTQMKEAGTAHWVAPNSFATNSSGFTAIPTGYYDVDAGFNNQNTEAVWIAMPMDLMQAKHVFASLTVDSKRFDTSFNEWRFTFYSGAAIRLVKD